MNRRIERRETSRRTFLSSYKEKLKILAIFIKLSSIKLTSDALNRLIDNKRDSAYLQQNFPYE